MWAGRQGNVMSVARITHQWSDEAATVLEVEVDGNHPDLLDELVSRVIRLWRETCADAGGEVGE